MLLMKRPKDSRRDVVCNSLAWMYKGNPAVTDTPRAENRTGTVEEPKENSGSAKLSQSNVYASFWKSRSGFIKSMPESVKGVIPEAEAVRP